MTSPHNNDTCIEQNRQCTYNVTSRRVQETIVAVEKQYVLHIGLCVCACACVWGGGYTGASVYLRECSLIIPACNAHLYCNLLPLWLHHIFRLSIIKETIFGKTLWSMKCVF
jgi:hypothetical protein